MNMNDIREEIDEVDSQLVKLLERRFALSLQAAEYKKEHNLMVLDSGRENEVLDKVAATATPPFKDVLRSLYISIMEHSRRLQHNYMDSSK